MMRFTTVMTAVLAGAASGLLSSAAFHQTTLDGWNLADDPYGIIESIAKGEETVMAFGPNRLSFPCADEHVDGIRANPMSLQDAFFSCREALAAQFASRKLEEPDLFAIFATIAVSRLAPYGNSSEEDWTKIPNEPSIHCSQHSIFVSKAIQHFYPDVDTVRYGIRGGMIGDHAIVSYRRGEFEMVLDGMVSLVVFHPMDGILAGDLVSVYSMPDFYSRMDEEVEITRRNIRGSLRMGAARPEHVYYTRTD